MSVVTVVNNASMAIGLWDIESSYHVARAMGGTMVIEPSLESRGVLSILSAVGSVSAVYSEIPVIAGEVVITGTPEVGETLTADGSAWVGEDSLAYQWYVGGVLESGATSATFVVPAEAAGEWIEVEVTATNGAGSDSATSDQFGPIAEV